MPSGIYHRANEKPKCPKCGGKGVFYFQDVRHYPSGDREIGYFDLCACIKEKKVIKLKQNHLVGDEGKNYKKV